jgi:DNA-binding MarR family transcriptional regulator
MNALDVHVTNTVIALTPPDQLNETAPRTTGVTTERAERSSRNDDKAILLGLLTAVEQNSALTQRSLSRELGIALGLANAYLKRCAKKGLIKVRQVPLNRYAYYLTPTGFTEKSRLTAEYLAVSFRFFRDARDQCTALFRACSAQGVRRVALVGEGELTEIAVMSASEASVEVVCVVDAASRAHRCAGYPVVADVDKAAAMAADGGGLDALVITDVRAPQTTYDATIRAAERAGIPPVRILAPKLLRITVPAARPNGSGAAS